MALIILDRDGVINEDSDAYIKSASEWIPLPGSIEAIARLSQAGHQIAIATNQSGLGRGYFEQSDLDAMHQKLTQLVSAAGGQIDHIVYCPHVPEAQCDCRKPEPGLLDQIEQALGISLQGVPLVGDSLRDLHAGLARGCVPILVRTGKGMKSEQKLADDPLLATASLQIFDDLAAFTDWFLGA